MVLVGVWHLIRSLQRLLLFLSLCLQDGLKYVRLSEHDSCLCQALCLVCILSRESLTHYESAGYVES